MRGRSLGRVLDRIVTFHVEAKEIERAAHVLRQGRGDVERAATGMWQDQAAQGAGGCALAGSQPLAPVRILVIILSSYNISYNTLIIDGIRSLTLEKLRYTIKP